MNFETAYLAALDALILAMGGVVPGGAHLNFRTAELARLMAIVTAAGGVLPGVGINYEQVTLNHWAAAIAGRGGTIPPPQANYRLAVLLHVQALYASLGVNLTIADQNFQDSILALLKYQLPLNFSTLPNLPSLQSSRVQAAAYRAAAGQSYSGQSVLDALASVNFISLLPEDGCCFSDAGGTTLQLTSGNVNSFKGWANSPVLGVSDNTKTQVVADSEGLNLANTAVDLPFMDGAVDASLLLTVDAEFQGSAISTDSRIGRFGGVTDSNLIGVDASSLSSIRLGLQGATNQFYNGGSASGSHTVIFTSDFTATNTRLSQAYRGSALINTVISHSDK